MTNEVLIYSKNQEIQKIMKRVNFIWIYASIKRLEKIIIKIEINKKRIWIDNVFMRSGSMCFNAN